MKTHQIAAALLLAALAASGGLQAREPGSEPSGPAAGEGRKGDPNRVICRRVDTIGTRLKSGRVCHTVAEWATIKQADRAELERIQNRRVTVDP